MATPTQQPVIAGVPAPLSRERIEQALQRHSWSYQVDSDGDVGGIWNGNTFYFFVTGEQDEILHIQSRWHVTLDIDQRLEALQAIDDWHRERLWPKAYTQVDDRGNVIIVAEHAVDWEFGLTDDQLFQTLLCAVAASLGLFDYLAQHFQIDANAI
ncbi:MAG: YbjN domain-containing protein [Propionibacteriaceae bacterium]|nr:YbjN domain-containing protein [Propionibacteriaceae bacterium]